MSEWQPIETAPLSGRILLGWRPAGGSKEHVEVGRFDHGRGVNTYGKPFSGNPDLWAPLPVMDNIIPLHTLCPATPSRDSTDGRGEMMDEERAANLEKYGRYSTKGDSEEMKTVYLRALAAVRAEAAQAEREACAKVVDIAAANAAFLGYKDAATEFEITAAAIRARGETREMAIKCQVQEQ